MREPKLTRHTRLHAPGSNHEIAEKLFVTEKTIKYHLTNIYAKLNVRSRAQLMVKYLKGEQDGEFCKLMRELINGEVGSK